MALDHSRLGLKIQIRPNLFCLTSLLYKILLTNLGVCKLTFYTFYTSHLRWNSTMRLCFYHTDLGQNVVFYNFEIKIALIQYSGPSKHTWAFRAGCELWSVWMNINRVTLQHKKNWNVSFLFSGFIMMCNLQRVWYRQHFEYSSKRCSWTTENKWHSNKNCKRDYWQSIEEI